MKTIILIVLTFVVVTSVLFSIINHHPKQNSINNITVSKFRLADVCSDCSIVGGTEKASTIIDIHTNTTHNRTSVDTPASVDVTHNRYISPSKSREAVVTEDGTQIYVVNFTSGTAKLLYTAPNGLGIGTIVWAPYEKSLTFNLGPVSTEMFHVVTSTTIQILNLESGQQQEVLQARKLGAGVETVMIEAVSSDEKKFLVSYSQQSLKYAIWDLTTKHLTPLDIPVTATVRYDPPSADGLEVSPQEIGALMWVDGSNLHLVQLKNFKESTLPLKNIAPSSGLPAMSDPSPAGDLVVYLRQDTSQSNKQLVLLNLLSGQERVLVNSLDIDPALINSTKWIPDETKIVYPVMWNGGVPTYAALSVDPNIVWSAPKIISDPIMPEGYGIEGFFYPVKLQ